MKPMLALAVLAAATLRAANYPAPVEADWTVRDFQFHGGDSLPELASWGVADINPRRLMRHLDYGRAAKSQYELVCLREASRLGTIGHLAAARAFTEGASEFEIELAFIRACGLREQELPYNPIIALNEGGAILHYQVLEKHPPTERHSLLIDAGAEFGVGGRGVAVADRDGVGGHSGSAGRPRTQS